MDIKEELKNFEAHCLQTGQLQVAELQRNSINQIAKLEAEVKYIKLEAVETDAECDAMTGKIAELEKGYEQLRIAALNAVCKIGGGQAKADLRDAYDKATEQLEALKEQDNG